MGFSRLVRVFLPLRIWYFLTIFELNSAVRMVVSDHFNQESSTRGSFGQYSRGLRKEKKKSFSKAFQDLMYKHWCACALVEYCMTICTAEYFRPDFTVDGIQVEAIQVTATIETYEQTAL